LLSNIDVIPLYYSNYGVKKSSVSDNKWIVIDNKVRELNVIQVNDPINHVTNVLNFFVNYPEIIISVLKFKRNKMKNLLDILVQSNSQSKIIIESYKLCRNV
jgi:hypothetical protein